MLKSNEEAIESVLEAISQAGYQPGAQIGICLDPASSEYFQDGKYVFKKSDKSARTSEQMVEFWANWVRQYPAIVSIEDGMSENDWAGWKLLTETVGDKIQLVGDDLFVTNPSIFKRGIDEGVANSILIKVNQIGTLTETLDAMAMAARAGYTAVVSHRSGETEDPFIADLAVATGAGQIKTGSASRTDRIAKYNQLLRIEEKLGAAAQFLGQKGLPAMTKLVLIRHGESTWNKENRFTGWTDVDLSEKGRQEAREGGEVLKKEGYTFDVAYTSVLKRAIRTLWTVLDEMDLMWIPVHRTWRLNERHYGALQGLNKAETAAKFGEDQVKIWRRSYDIPPPALTPDDERFPGRDPRYRNVEQGGAAAHRVPQGHGRALSPVLA